MRTATPYAILYVLCFTFRLVMLALEIGNSINTQFASNAISDAAMIIDKVLEFTLLRFIMNAREVHVKLLSDSYQDFQLKLKRHRMIVVGVYLLFLLLNVPILIMRILIQCNELNDLC